MPSPPSSDLPPIEQVLEIMRALRSPEGCPWDREQDHRSLRWHAVEEVYELLDAIEAGDDIELAEELGDLLLQVIFHAQLAAERQCFDFDGVCRRLASKLVGRHPHVFGEVEVSDVDEVWANWERIKREEKQGTEHERPSALDGIPRHLPALARAQKLMKKASRAGLVVLDAAADSATEDTLEREKLGTLLFEIARQCQTQGWSAEELLRNEIERREEAWRDIEAERGKTGE
jgi:MazG family protein